MSTVDFWKRVEPHELVKGDRIIEVRLDTRGAGQVGPNALVEETFHKLKHFKGGFIVKVKDEFSKGKIYFYDSRPASYAFYRKERRS